MNNPVRFPIESTLKATNSKSLPSQDVFVAALAYLKMESEKFRQKKNIENIKMDRYNGSLRCYDLER